MPTGLPSHTPVLLAETLSALALRPGDCYVDLTAGLGGHAAAAAALVAPGGSVVLFDLDPGNLARAAQRVRDTGVGIEPVTVHGSFADAPEHLARLGVKADAALADLGFSSSQVDDPSRGLSFKADGPLDMRLDPTAATTAADLVASLREEDLAKLIFELGEDRYARRIARNVVAARSRSPITTTGELASIVRASVPSPGGPHHRRGIDPATRTFQALRIAVNDEIGSLERLLRRVEDDARAVCEGKPPVWMKPGSRMAIIAFHSLEDRPVKQVFRSMTDRGLAAGITRKPIVAGETETAANPRSRSAKLRAIRLAEREISGFQ